MDTNSMVHELIYPELSYLITGVLFSTHNDLGSYARERQYADSFEKKLKELKIPYERELLVGDSGNIIDFAIDNKIVVEMKTVRILTREDYYQVQRYLQASKLRLGLLVNFRNKFIKPVRIIKIDNRINH